MEDKNYDLRIEERLVLLELLPKTGNFLTLKSLRRGRERLALSDEEIKKFKVKISEDRNTVRWDVEAAKETTNISFSDSINDIIISTLKKLNNDNTLEEKHFSLYEKFIGG